MSPPQVTDRDRTALPQGSSASPKPLEVLQNILPAWEHTDSFLAGSVRQFKSVDQTLNALTNGVCKLPNNSTRASIAENIIKLQQAVDDQQEASEKEAEMSKSCLRAFQKKRVIPLGRAGRNYLEVFVQVLNSAPEDMTVGELQRSFAMNLASVKAHRGVAGSGKQGSVTRREIVPKTSLEDGGVKVQSHRPNKTNHAAGTSEQPLKDTTNLKPTPKTHTVANAVSRGQDRVQAPSVFEPKSNKIRLVTSKSLLSREKAPKRVTTEPCRTGSKSESKLGDAQEDNRSRPIEDVPTVVTASDEARRVQDTTRKIEVQHQRLETDKYSAEEVEELTSHVPVVIAGSEGDIDLEKSGTPSKSPMSKSGPAPGEPESDSIETAADTSKPKELSTSEPRSRLPFNGRKNIHPAGMPGVAIKKRSTRKLKGPDDEPGNPSGNAEREPLVRNHKVASEAKKKLQDGKSVVEDSDAEAAASEKSDNGRPSNANEPQIDRSAAPIFNLEDEGIDLENLVYTKRRDNTGGGSAPRNHTRQPESQSGNKRKRFEHDDGSMPVKKSAIEGRYISRPKVCSSSLTLLVRLLI
jgi:hypothetical protein